MCILRSPLHNNNLNITRAWSQNRTYAPVSSMTVQFMSYCLHNFKASIQPMVDFYFQK